MANRTKTTTIKRKPLKTLCINVCHVVAFCPSWILRLNIQFLCAVHGFWGIRMCGERAYIGVRQLASSAFTAMRHRIPNANAIEEDWIYKKKTKVGETAETHVLLTRSIRTTNITNTHTAKKWRRLLLWLVTSVKGLTLSYTHTNSRQTAIYF